MIESRGGRPICVLIDSRSYIIFLTLFRGRRGASKALRWRHRNETASDRREPVCNKSGTFFCSDHSSDVSWRASSNNCSISILSPDAIPPRIHFFEIFGFSGTHLDGKGRKVEILFRRRSYIRMTALLATDMPVERRSLDLLLGPREVLRSDD